MKIVFFSQNLANYISGGRQYPWFMGHCLANAGHEVLFISDGEPLFDRDFENFPGRSKISLHIRDLYYGSKRKDIMDRIKNCDLVMASPMTSMDYGVSLAKLYGKKIIGLLYEPQPLIEEAIGNGVEIPQPTVQEGPHGAIQHDPLSDFAKQLHKTDMILCNTKNGVEATRQWFPKYGGKIEYLYNGFSTHIADKVPFVPYDKRENSIVYLSRTVKYKGFGDLLYIFAQTKNKPTIHFISGFIDMKQPLLKQFFQTCKDQKLNVVLHDRINELEKFKILAKAKALFHPSRFEGFGIPPAEAFYMRTPVICYDLPVLVEIYKQYPHYLPYNDFHSGIALFDDLFDNPDHLFSRCKDAKKAVSEFCTVDNYTDKINEIVCRLVGHPFKKLERKAEQISKIEGFGIDKQTPKTIVSSVGVKEIGVFEFNRDWKEFNEYKYVIFKNKDVKLSTKIEEEALIRFKETDCDFMTFNHKMGAKEINLPNNCVELSYIKPGCFGGVVACKVSALDITNSNKFRNLEPKIWELDLRLSFRKYKWYHSRRPCFDLKERPELDKTLCLQRIKKYFEKTGLAENFEVNYNSNDSIRVNPYTALTSEVLMIIPARTNIYLPQLMKTLNDCYGRDRIRTVLCYHDPEGKKENFAEIKKTYALYGGKDIETFTGKFNFCKMNNDIFKKHGKNYGKVILCNDDISLSKFTINNLIAGFKYGTNKSWRDIGIVGGKLLSPSLDEKEFAITQDWSLHKAKTQHCGVTLLRDRNCTHMYHRFPATRICTNYFKRCDAVTFGLVAIDSECYESVMLDETYPNDLNDIDFCVRATQKGWGILYNPTSIAYHFETVTRKLFKIQDDIDARMKFKKQHKAILEKVWTTDQFVSFQTNMG